MSMRFHPKRRASTDQAPGPSSARAAPRVAIRIRVHGSPGCEKTFHTSMTTRSDPATGVHKPAIRSIPAPVAITHNMAGPNGGPLHSFVTPRSITSTPVTRRMSNRPIPGQPRANVENSLRKGTVLSSRVQVRKFPMGAEPQKGSC